MLIRQSCILSALGFSALLAAFPAAAAAKTHCVNPNGSHGCSSTIQAAVNAASPRETIMIEQGIYTEYVVISRPVSLIGEGDGATVIDATNLPHGIFVDGFNYPAVNNVTIRGITVQNANFEGVLAVNARDLAIEHDRIIDNDKSEGLSFTGATIGCPGQPGNGLYENDETGDCGGGLHLIGVTHSIVSHNVLNGNADGLLMSDETGPTAHNLIISNEITDNALECGIVLASHPPSGHTSPPFAAHFGVYHNTIAGNLSSDNGVKVGGSGVGLFSDGNGPGRVSENLIIENRLIGNGLGGLTLHTHVGPNFGLPADDLNNNQIIRNYIAGNLADTDDTATPGRVGININSGGGGTPVTGTVIEENVIRDEDQDVAINTPAVVHVRFNDLLGKGSGVANLCAYDATLNGVPANCTEPIHAAENYWGCPGGPGATGCTTTYGPNITFTPWLHSPIGEYGED